MAKKVVAVVLLVAMAAWAELALAPMIAMHAGHKIPGHEMAADMPAHQHHHGTKAHERAAAGPCCPGFHGGQPEEALTLLADARSCDDPHSCCFRQGPQSVPAPVRDAQHLNREIAPIAVAHIAPVHDAAPIARPDGTLAQSPPVAVFGMILRV